MWIGIICTQVCMCNGRAADKLYSSLPYICLSFKVYVCVCVCIWERERERWERFSGENKIWKTDSVILCFDRFPICLLAGETQKRKFELAFLFSSRKWSNWKVGFRYPFFLCLISTKMGFWHIIRFPFINVFGTNEFGLRKRILNKRYEVHSGLLQA